MRDRIVKSWVKILALALVACLLAVLPMTTAAQDRLSGMPGYDQYQKMSKLLAGGGGGGKKGGGGGKKGGGGGDQPLVKSGAITVTWKEGGKSFEYSKDGKRYLYDIAAAKATEIGNAPDDEIQADEVEQTDIPEFGPTPQARGRQVASETSPDEKRTAFYRDYNLWITEPKGTKGPKDVAVTTDGSPTTRIKYGTASWVYGEELAQKSAMWWAPDSKSIAVYRFDESKVRDYYLPIRQSSIEVKLDTEAYPKPGKANPIAEIFVYDLESKKTVQIDVRDGKPFEDSVVGHYVYNVRWSPDGKEVFFNRTNRRQNILELAAADPQTGKCRVIVHEEWPESWVVNRPPMQYLKDRKRFIWTSERNGYKNLYLYDLTGQLLTTITNNNFDIGGGGGGKGGGGILKVDEKAGLVYYMAHDGDNHMKGQLHIVGIDGKGDRRVTDPAFNHKVDIAPDGKHFIDVIETHDTPPASRLVTIEGKVLEELAKSDTTRFDKIGLKRVELITYKAGDGKTDLHGMLHFPSNFDPSKKYPLLVSVYGGPNTSKAKETFSTPSLMTEYGFLFAELDSRSASGRGKRFTDAIYQKLGVTEIDDQAAGVKSLWDRPYLDKNRVGIYGTSYGGYASVMCILRHPSVFQAACASSPVTDWRHYDSIYTERYMWIPQENKAGYDAGSAMTYAGNLKGRLMLFYGTEDNNVHPSNTLALIKAFRTVGKSFELQVGPDMGHSGIGQPRMMEFFIENLVMRK
jgi:dipeptidyl-peptidase-4